MRTSYHSAHQPKCTKNFLNLILVIVIDSFSVYTLKHKGPLGKNYCKRIFVESGCDLCLKLFDNTSNLHAHRMTCCLSPVSLPGLEKLYVCQEVQDDMETDNTVPKVVAMDCEMVGGGSDGSLDVCARVCMVDLKENVIFHSYVKPIIPVTDYRYEVTGIKEDHLLNAMHISEIQKKVLEILYNGEESLARIRLDGGRACLLVGHSLDNDLDGLRINYPDHLIRDTAKYMPLRKTNLVSHSLKYLTRTYLGYEIQAGVHDPYEDCVAALRLYKRMQSQEHHSNEGSNGDVEKRSSFGMLRVDELLHKSPDDLLMLSASNYRCWCLDRRQLIDD
ncbi:Small RNA degrading nuclease 1 [Apostasia shenzhenica]|uniref:RNA exonuclease 4 n=1 Tax=Apostasia shenzhenica TaxID=1088818 RepID=A0A2I0BGC5_9ASPA|nr:Small RNA degrading nuclease 1 [Apostasia shenzhenica]